MTDKEAIHQVALDYVEGWYQANAPRMGRALSEKLMKRRVTPEGEYWEVNRDWMIEATANGQGKIEEPEKGRKEVTILDLTDRMASVRIASNKFIDYIHLGKVGEKWEIINVLWDFIT